MEATLLVIPLKVCSFYDFLNQKIFRRKKVAFILIFLKIQKEDNYE